jgi:prephenate dehydrogenase
LGLIGGSLARDLAARGIHVLGWDTNFASFQGAFTTGAANDLFAVGPDAPVRADVVVIAVPVLAAAQVLRSLAPHLDGVRLVTDVGSTKASIVRAAEELGIGARFVGSHPLAGDHRSGWDASRAGLFDGARVFLTPTPSTGDHALHLAKELWTMVDARPEVMDAEEHDARLAWTSHLPQAVSTALALSLDQSGIPRSELGPGGRDVTRLAGSNPDVWIDILLDNADALGPALGSMAARLSGLQRAVMTGDRDDLQRLLAEARTWHGADS